MLQLMNIVATPSLVQPRASLHDVAASKSVALPTRPRQSTSVKPISSSSSSSSPPRDTRTHLDPNLSVEELISRLVQDCFDNAVSGDDDAVVVLDERIDAQPTPVDVAMASRSLGVATDASDSDSGVSTLSDAASASASVSGVEVDAASSQCSTPDVDQPVDVMAKRVIFGGRDILDLARTLADPSWRMQATQLPPMNLDMFWKNRSQYHRLGDFGAAETHRQVCCYACDFHFPVPN